MAGPGTGKGNGAGGKPKNGGPPRPVQAAAKGQAKKKRNGGPKGPRKQGGGRAPKGQSKGGKSYLIPRPFLHQRWPVQGVERSYEYTGETKVSISSSNFTSNNAFFIDVCPFNDVVAAWGVSAGDSPITAPTANFVHPTYLTSLLTVRGGGANAVAVRCTGISVEILNLTPLAVVGGTVRSTRVYQQSVYPFFSAATYNDVYEALYQAADTDTRPAAALLQGAQVIAVPIDPTVLNFNTPLLGVNAWLAGVYSNSNTTIGGGIVRSLVQPWSITRIVVDGLAPTSALEVTVRYCFEVSVPPTDFTYNMTSLCPQGPPTPIMSEGSRVAKTCLVAISTNRARSGNAFVGV